ncbi:MAG: hypothetical protein CMQ08_11365 [Gammaproteobacteria bacterium]|uniref:Antitermination protein NusG n=1 Tax=OM182 bacterium MED-G28 TaxID=1986256 RepID=A0A2A5W853_9GAMM|nr:hypothetical protein [Gammaproteobacteria bacterium]PDH32478.1 MAG: hypothetical protein CNF02_11895 [OM182 bacterium MED-G28]
MAVIIGAFFVIRQRHANGENDSTSRSNKTEKAKTLKSNRKDELSADLRAGAYMFLFLMVGIGATLYYFDWQDDHTVLTVNLHRDNNAAVVSYEVYKYQLESRSFITTDGRSITVASSERIEILGLED